MLIFTYWYAACMDYKKPKIKELPAKVATYVTITESFMYSSFSTSVWFLLLRLKWASS